MQAKNGFRDRLFEREAYAVDDVGSLKIEKAAIGSNRVHYVGTLLFLVPSFSRQFCGKLVHRHAELIH